MWRTVQMCWSWTGSLYFHVDFRKSISLSYLALTSLGNFETNFQGKDVFFINLKPGCVVNLRERPHASLLFVYVLRRLHGSCVTGHSQCLPCLSLQALVSISSLKAHKILDEISSCIAVLWASFDSFELAAVRSGEMARDRCVIQQFPKSFLLTVSKSNTWGSFNIEIPGLLLPGHLLRRIKLILEVLCWKLWCIAGSGNSVSSSTLWFYKRWNETQEGWTIAIHQLRTSNPGPFFLTLSMSFSYDDNRMFSNNSVSMAVLSHCMCDHI